MGLLAVDWVVCFHLNSFHFRAYCFLVVGAQDWSMVSTTLVERLEAMRCAPQGPHPQFPLLRAGVKDESPIRERRSPLVRISKGEPSSRDI